MKRTAETLLKGRYIVSTWGFEREEKKERANACAEVTRSEEEDRGRVREKERE